MIIVLNSDVIVVINSECMCIRITDVKVLKNRILGLHPEIYWILNYSRRGPGLRLEKSNI